MSESTTTTSTTSIITTTRSCDACYSGCVQVTPDECVRYTGPDSLALQIQTGDSLAVVEQRLIDYLTSCLDGTGINLEINPGIICPVVQTFLPVSPECIYTLPEYLTALTRGICYVQDEVSTLQFELSRLQGTYNVNCLVGVLPDSGTVAILQATINKACQTATSLTNLTLDVQNNYVSLDELNGLIQAYLDQQSSGSTQQYTKMVPYTVVEYYGPLTNFDGTGAGISTLGWDKVYLCNGANGTPDKRGRVGVGAIAGIPGGGPLNFNVDPTYTGNPNYALGDTTGTNLVSLTIPQLPSHTHTTNVSQSTSSEANGLLTDPGHFHYAGNSPEGWDSAGEIGIVNRAPQNVQTTVSKTGISVTTNVGVSNNNTGGNQGHANIQPVLATYYIMYIP